MAAIDFEVPGILLISVCAGSTVKLHINIRGSVLRSGGTIGSAAFLTILCTFMWQIMSEPRFCLPRFCLHSPKSQPGYYFGLIELFSAVYVLLIGRPTCHLAFLGSQLNGTDLRTPQLVDCYHSPGLFALDLLRTC